MRNGLRMTMICDSHVLIFDALAPYRLGHKAADLPVQAEARGDPACADVSRWEIAMMLNKDRLHVDADIRTFLRNVISARNIQVPPITVEIAELSQHLAFGHRDPAHRLIAATAIHHRAPLLTSDERLHAIDALETLW